MKATIKAMGQGRPTPKDGKQIVGATADFSEKGITTKFHG